MLHRRQDGTLHSDLTSHSLHRHHLARHHHSATTPRMACNRTPQTLIPEGGDWNYKDRCERTQLLHKFWQLCAILIRALHHFYTVCPTCKGVTAELTIRSGEHGGGVRHSNPTSLSGSAAALYSLPNILSSKYSHNPPLCPPPHALSRSRCFSGSG
jgi:hypothetical protein